MKQQDKPDKPKANKALVKKIAGNETARQATAAALKAGREQVKATKPQPVKNG